LRDFDAQTVKYVEIAYPIDYLKDGIVLVDTPGIEDIEQQRVDITYGYMPVSDATILLLDATAPLRNSEKNFLTDQVFHSNIPTIFFVINQIDKISDSELARIKKDIENKLKKIIELDNYNIYPISAKLAIKGKLNSNRNALDKSQLSVFEKELENFIMSSERTHNKIKKMNLQTNMLSKLLLEEIEISENQLSKTFEDLEKMDQNLSKSENDYNERFRKLLKYFDEQINLLKLRVESSINKNHIDLTEKLMIEIETIKGDLKEFAEKILPYKIKQTVKNWLEQSQNLIDNNIVIIIQKTLEGYERYFSKKVIIDQIGKNDVALISSIDSVTLEKSTEQIDKNSFSIGAVAMGSLAIVTGIASGGLTLLPLITATFAGGGIGKLLGHNISKNIINEQKIELKNKLPDILQSIFADLHKSVITNIDNLSSNLKNKLNTDFQRHFQEIKEQLQTQIKESNNEKNTIKNKQLTFQQIRSEIILK